MTNPALAHELIRFLVAVAVLLFAIRLMTKMSGIGGNAVKQLVNALLEALVSILILPFKLLTGLLKRFFR